jgi:outer membrane protein
VEQSLQDSPEVKRLESALVAKGLDVKAQRAARLPRLDLVAAYALLAKYNNYEQFFNAFQRNNGQIGISLQIPVLTGSAINAAVAQAETEGAHLRIEIEAVRNRIALDVHQQFGEIRRAQTARAVSQADLDVARENLSVLIAQMGEGRAGLRQVEEARFVENEKWIAFYDAQFAMEKARLNLLRQTGQLVAEIQ